MSNNIKHNFEKLTESIIEKAQIFDFNLNQLPEHNDFKTDIRKDINLKSLFERLNNIENNCLYWFECESIKKCNELNQLLDIKRHELNLNHRVVPIQNKNSESKILYVGIRRGGKRKYDGLTNISGRIIQHLGYYEKGSTQGLQFIHWINKKDFRMKLNFVEFNDLPNEYLNVIEKLVAFKLKPLCGKH